MVDLLDPLLALSASLVGALPYQISAVYDTILRRQPLQFPLADDPSAGKTIMAGLLIDELMLRGDAERCLIFAYDNILTDDYLSDPYLCFSPFLRNFRHFCTDPTDGAPDD